MESTPAARDDPLPGCYLLVVVSEPFSEDHKHKILQRVAKGLLSWDVAATGCDLSGVGNICTNVKNSEDQENELLIQYSTESLAVEVLMSPQVSTLKQCLKNLLLATTGHKLIVHAGYAFTGSGSWILQNGTFSVSEFGDAFHDADVQKTLKSQPKCTVHVHCTEEGEWTNANVKKQTFSNLANVTINPPDKVDRLSGAEALLDCLDSVLNAPSLVDMMKTSPLVGNIRFNRPTLYVFPGGQGDCALFGISGFNMLIDGGFNRKPCSWEFIRHLDRLDAVLVTRLSESNLCGLSTMMKRKAVNNTSPQIGYVFCNIAEGKWSPTDEMQKDKDDLLISVVGEGHNFIQNLHSLKLKPHQCWRDNAMDPFVLYHKVGHGTLEMYVLSPPKDSKEMKEFLHEWSSHKEKFSCVKSGLKVQNHELAIPLSHAMSICALLVWKPSDPKENITRILFPGSTPQARLLEGLEKLKSLDLIKHPTCTKASLTAALIGKPKDKAERPLSKAPLNRKNVPSPSLSASSVTSRNGDIHLTKKENKEVSTKPVIDRKTPSRVAPKSPPSKPQAEPKEKKLPSAKEQKPVSAAKKEAKPAAPSKQPEKPARKAPKPDVDKSKGLKEVTNNKKATESKAAVRKTPDATAAPRPKAAAPKSAAKADRTKPTPVPTKNVKAKAGAAAAAVATSAVAAVVANQKVEKEKVNEVKKEEEKAGKEKLKDEEKKVEEAAKVEKMEDAQDAKVGEDKGLEIEEVKIEEKTEEAKVEETKIEDFKEEDAKVDEIKEEAKIDEVKQEEPSAEEPKEEVIKAEEAIEVTREAEILGEAVKVEEAAKEEFVFETKEEEKIGDAHLEEEMKPNIKDMIAGETEVMEEKFDKLALNTQLETVPNEQVLAKEENQFHLEDDKEEFDFIQSSPMKVCHGAVPPAEDLLEDSEQIGYSSPFSGGKNEMETSFYEPRDEEEIQEAPFTTETRAVDFTSPLPKEDELIAVQDNMSVEAIPTAPRDVDSILAGATMEGSFCEGLMPTSDFNANRNIEDSYTEESTEEDLKEEKYETETTKDDLSDLLSQDIAKEQKFDLEQHEKITTDYGVEQYGMEQGTVSADYGIEKYGEEQEKITTDYGIEKYGMEQETVSADYGIEKYGMEQETVPKDYGLEKYDVGQHFVDNTEERMVTQEESSAPGSLQTDFEVRGETYRHSDDIMSSSVSILCDDEGQDVVRMEMKENLVPEESAEKVDYGKLSVQIPSRDTDDDDEDIMKSPTPHAVVDYEGQEAGRNDQRESPRDFVQEATEDLSEDIRHNESSKQERNEGLSKVVYEDDEMIRYPTPPGEQNFYERVGPAGGVPCDSSEMVDPITQHFVTNPQRQGQEVIDEPLYEESDEERSESPVEEQPVYGNILKADFPEFVNISGGTTPSEPQSPKSPRSRGNGLLKEGMTACSEEEEGEEQDQRKDEPKDWKVEGSQVPQSDAELYEQNMDLQDSKMNLTQPPPPPDNFLNEQNLGSAEEPHSLQYSHETAEPVEQEVTKPQPPVSFQSETDLGGYSSMLPSYSDPKPQDLYSHGDVNRDETSSPESEESVEEAEEKNGFRDRFSEHGELSKATNLAKEPEAVLHESSQGVMQAADYKDVHCEPSNGYYIESQSQKEQDSGVHSSENIHTNGLDRAADCHHQTDSEGQHSFSSSYKSELFSKEYCGTINGQDFKDTEPWNGCSPQEYGSGVTSKSGLSTLTPEEESTAYNYESLIVNSSKEDAKEMYHSHLQTTLPSDDLRDSDLSPSASYSPEEKDQYMMEHGKTMAEPQSRYDSELIEGGMLPPRGHGDSFTSSDIKSLSPPVPRVPRGEDPYGVSSEEDDSSSLPDSVSPHAYTNKAYVQEDVHLYKHDMGHNDNSLHYEDHTARLSSEEVDSHTVPRMTYSPGFPDIQGADSNYEFRLEDWGKPMGLPSPPPNPSDSQTSTTTKKAASASRGTSAKGMAAKPSDKRPSVDHVKNGTTRSPMASPSKSAARSKAAAGAGDGAAPVYVDLAYVPHHADPYYCNEEFFKRVRARYYVLSGTSPSKEVLNALLEAKKGWKEEMEVTIIPTYETDTLGYWMALNQDTLAEYMIDVAPSASRCTVNLQDHETSCAAYRLEF